MTWQSTSRSEKPWYVSEFIHEMMWGKTLRHLVKRGIELAADARERYSDDVRINLHIAWFGHELVVEDGIAHGRTTARTAIGRRS